MPESLVPGLKSKLGNTGTGPFSVLNANGAILSIH